METNGEKAGKPTAYDATLLAQIKRLILSMNWTMADLKKVVLFTAMLLIGIILMNIFLVIRVTTKKFDSLAVSVSGDVGVDNSSSYGLKVLT